MRDYDSLDLIAPPVQEAGVRQNLLHAKVREAAPGVDSVRSKESPKLASPNMVGKYGRIQTGACGTHSGNISPASIKIYLPLTPTSMQFIPISPSPPMGRILSGGPSSGGGPGKGLQRGRVNF
jgi:hypothetical protein